MKDDPEYAERAERFSVLTQDITEFLVQLPFQPPKTRLERTVTYQDPCHLAHAQRIIGAPRQILQSIPGVKLVELDEAAVCCGSAGFYSAVQPELSQRLLDRKVKRVESTGAQQVITANPGCMAQLERGLKAHSLAIPVSHVVDLLDEAYQAEGFLR